MEFAGKRVLVTGGAQGIGQAAVKRFAGAGAKVITRKGAATARGPVR